MRLRAFFPTVLSVVACLAGCDSDVQIAAGGAGSSTSSTPSSTGSSGTGYCPASPPESGSACSEVGRSCTYGDDPRPVCRTSAGCSPMGWKVEVPTCPAPTPPEVCGTSPQTNGTQCAMEGAYCVYADDTICGCSACAGGPCMQFPVWNCTKAQGGCPPPTPNSGAACSPNLQQCDYGQPCGAGGISMSCVAGFWQWQSFACPL
ncbi:MAG: hypothetical protein U0414_11400 [Polyangiaceae bacterium]